MINLRFTGAPVFIRMLSHQLTGHVVWYSIDTNLSPPARRVPACCPDLDYVTYVGSGPETIASFWSLFKQYQLVYSQADAKFDTDALAAEFVDHIKLERARCYATQLVHSAAQWVAEKNGLVENPLYDPMLEPDRVAKIIAAQHNISVQDAIKLQEFKAQEHSIALRNLRYTQIEAEMAIIQSPTAEHVVDVYKSAMVSFGRLRANEQTLTRFL